MQGREARASKQAAVFCVQPSSLCASGREGGVVLPLAGAGRVWFGVFFAAGRTEELGVSIRVAFCCNNGE